MRLPLAATATAASSRSTGPSPTGWASSKSSWSAVAGSGPAEHRRQDLLRDPFRAPAAHAGLLPRGGARPGRARAARRAGAGQRGRAADEAGKLSFIRITVFNATDRRRYERELLDARRTADQAQRRAAGAQRHLERRVEEAVAERLKAEEALRQARRWRPSAS